MHLQPQLCAKEKPFTTSQTYCNAVFGRLNAGSTHGMDHGQIELYLSAQSREMARLMMQDAMDQTSRHDRQLSVIGADGVERTHQRRGTRVVHTVVGAVNVSRETYAARKTAMLAPVDAVLNLPEKSYSFGVRRHIAEQAALVSYDASVKTVQSLGSITVPKRQAEEQTAAAAVDFEAFYAQRKHAPAVDDASSDDFMVISVDGKGIVMRPDSLRDSTRKKAMTESHKLSKRLSKGEKKDRKRMAQVAAVYSIQRHERTADDIVAPLRHVRDASAKPAPKPTKKRVWASIKKPMEGVNSDVFDEALARDPGRKKTWVALVDGNKNQLGDILALAKIHQIEVTLIIDIIHVIPESSPHFFWMT